jgi:integrase
MSRTQAQGLHRLSAAGVKHLDAPGWYCDGGGLYLEIDANGRKRWAMRLTVNGRRRDFGLGPLHKVSLAQARETAAEYRAKAYRGIDPIAHKGKSTQTVANAPPFRDAAEQVYRQRAPAWSNGKHSDQWINSLRDYAFPVIGDIPVSAVSTPDVLKVLSPIWNVKIETARRVRQRIKAVLEWSRAAGFRDGENPVDQLGHALPRQKKSERHHAALPYAEVANFIEMLRLGPAASITKLAFEFLILTAVRSIEARKAHWDEVDFKTKTWTIPGVNETTGRRMKRERDHIVPLSIRCLQILELARAMSASHELIFPDSDTGKVMSENRFLNARDSLNYAKERCTPHGFRSSFRDWAAEETNFPNEVLEMALAHAIPNKVEAAYRRGQLLAKRFELMEAWAAYACPSSPVDSAKAA